METQINLSWAAGFFDGEGSIYLSANKSPNLLVSAVQIDPIPLYKFKNMFGGVISEEKTPKGKKCFRWYAQGPLAIKFLEVVYPYLTVKKKEARIAKGFKLLISGKGNKLTDQNRVSRNIMRQKLKNVKLERYK